MDTDSKPFVEKPKANIPTSPYAQGDLERKWNTRNWRTEASISRSDTHQHRPRGKLLGKKLSPQGRCGRSCAANRSQRNWFAATAGAMIWLRVLSSGEIADAGSASVSATVRRHQRRRQRPRSSSTTTCAEGPGSKGLVSLTKRLTRSRSPTTSLIARRM